MRKGMDVVQMRAVRLKPDGTVADSYSFFMRPPWGVREKQRRRKASIAAKRSRVRNRGV